MGSENTLVDLPGRMEGVASICDMVAAGHPLSTSISSCSSEDTSLWLTYTGEI